MHSSRENIQEIYLQFRDIVHQFARALHANKTEYTRDSAIKRFELAFELAWKLLKLYIEEFHGIICQSPRSCIREAYRLSILEYDDYWMQLTDLRNKTAHIYSLQMSEEIYSELPEVLKRFEKLMEFFEESLGNN